MSWIKFETATSDKPEVWEISAKLGIDPDAVVGKLLRVWTWFDLHTENGNAPSVTKSLLDAHVRVTGFCLAMIEAGWMLEEKGMVQLPNFNRHNGKTAKTRVLTAKRVANARSGNGDVTLANQKCNAVIVTDALPREEKNRIEKSREEKNTDSSSEPSQASEPVDSSIAFECIGKDAGWWNPPLKLIADLKSWYPSHDITAELRKAAGWHATNPAKRKTKKGMPAFLNGWMQKAKPSTATQSPPYDSSKLVAGSLKPGDPGYDSPEYKKLLVQHARESEARRLNDAKRIPD